MAASPFACPNNPPCAHSGTVHDIYAPDDPRPVCCAEGCGCGHQAGYRPVSDAELAELQRRFEQASAAAGRARHMRRERRRLFSRRARFRFWRDRQLTSAGVWLADHGCQRGYDRAVAGHRVVEGLMAWLGVRVEAWWKAEKASSRLWHRFCPEDKVSYWLDWLPAFTYRHRKNAERRRWERIHGEPL